MLPTHGLGAGVLLRAVHWLCSAVHGRRGGLGHAQRGLTLTSVNASCDASAARTSSMSAAVARTVAGLGTRLPASTCRRKSVPHTARCHNGGTQGEWQALRGRREGGREGLWWPMRWLAVKAVKGRQTLCCVLTRTPRPARHCRLPNSSGRQHRIAISSRPAA